MTATIKIDPNGFQLMRDFIEQNCGIYLADDKMYLLETRLTKLMVESGCSSFVDFYHKAASDDTYKLRDKVIEAITTNETFWFRDESSFAILDEVLLGELASEIESGKRSKMRIWCTACSTGQEPYSIAMTVLEFVRRHYSLKPEHFEIIGTDISSAVLYIAKAGSYDSRAITRGLSEDFKNQYFDPDGKVWVLKNNVKKMVKYNKINLKDDFSFLGKQDIIFCRYVLIYFSEEFKKDILRRITQLLRPDGYLLVGASESIINFTQEYEMLPHTGGLYYKVKP